MAQIGDLTVVDNFLSTNQAGRYADAWKNPSPESLERARSLYIQHHGGMQTSQSALHPSQPSQKLHGYVIKFNTDVKSLLTEAKDKEAAEAFDCKSWDELRLEVTKSQLAHKKHEDKRKDWRNNPTEVADRLAGDFLRRIEFLVELVPDGDYTSILAGALTMLCNAARRKQDIRERIWTVLNSLGDKIQCSGEQIQLYRFDKDLKDKSEGLYQSILELAHKAVEYLAKPAFKESLKAVVKQKDYTPLNDAIQNVDKAVEAFRERISTCLQQRVGNIDMNVEKLKSPILAMYAMLADMLVEFPAQLQQLAATFREKATPSQVNTYLFMHPTQLQTSIRTAELRQVLSTSCAMNGQSVQEDMLQNAKTDLQEAMGFVPTSMNQEQIGLLTSDMTFVAWLKSLASQMLIVHDEAALEHNSSLSTLSYLCAAISKMLTTPGIFCLSFFCGLRSMPGSTFEGANGLLRSLIVQLLQYLGDCTLNLPGVSDLNAFGQGLVMDNLLALESLFSLLIDSFPAGVIYVIVDGAFWYGTEAREEGMQRVIEFLAKHALHLRRIDRGLVLKLLVTNPTARQLNSWEFQASSLHIDQTIVAGGHGGSMMLRC